MLVLKLTTLLHKSPNMDYVKHNKLVKNTLPSHHVKHDDAIIPSNCRRAEKQAVSRHPGWLELSLKRVLSVEFVGLSPGIPKELSEVHTSFTAPRLGIAQALMPSCILLRVPHNRIVGGLEAWMSCSMREVWLAGV
jgi:hypothetical protein